MKRGRVRFEPRLPVATLRCVEGDGHGDGLCTLYGSSKDVIMGIEGFEVDLPVPGRAGLLSHLRVLCAAAGLAAGNGAV